jgi:transcriptional regulator with XRE-family HTH domain
VTEFGAELRRRRTARGWSLSDLAEAVHYDRGYLSKVERGLRVPAPAVVRLCDAAVEAGGALIALAPSLVPETSVALPSARPVSGLVRMFEQGAAGAAAFADDHRTTAEGARLLFQALRAQGHVAAPNSVLPALAAEFGVLRAAAHRSRGTARRQLILLAAQYAEYAGWMIQERGDEAGAIALTETATTLARLAGDPGFVACALVRQADVELYRGDGGAVVRLARQAIDEGATAAVRVLATQRLAQGWALIGRPRECRDALMLAEEAAVTAMPGAETTFGSHGGGRLMDVVRGWCLLDLGRPDEAADALAAGLAVAPPQAHRARALYGVRLALSHATDGDWRSARRAGFVALAEAHPVDSASVRHQLHKLATVVRRRRSDDEAGDFGIDIDRALAAGRLPA